MGRKVVKYVDMDNLEERYRDMAEFLECFICEDIEECSEDEYLLYIEFKKYGYKAFDFRKNRFVADRVKCKMIEYYNR